MHSDGVSELVPSLRGISHAAACVLAVAAAVVLIVLAPGGRAVVAVAIYGGGLIALFGGSALYHRWPGPTRFKPLLRRIDHSTIFVFIAASYTPVALIVMDGPIAWVLLIVAGGLLYSLGAVVYARQRPDPWPRTFGFHEIFHALVIVAAAAHYVAMIGWVVPSAA